MFGKKADIFESVVTQVLAMATPSSGDNLTGFEYDADHFLGESGFVTDVTTRRMPDPRCLLLTRATVTDKARSLQDVASSLRAAWVQLAYSEFEASSCSWYREATVFRFVTVMGSGIFVTGRIIASGGPHDRLVERFLREFGDLHGPLEPLPQGFAP